MRGVLVLLVIAADDATTRPARVSIKLDSRPPRPLPPDRLSLSCDSLGLLHPVESVVTLVAACTVARSARGSHLPGDAFPQ